MFSVRTRILLLLSAVTAIFLLGIFGWQRLEKRQAALLSGNDRREKSLFFDKLLTLKGASIESFAFDDTTWDEMARFVRTGDKNWAAQNLDSSLPSFDADGAWVYDTRFRPVCGVTADGNAALKRLPLPPAALRGALGTRPFCHVFMHTPRGLLELRGAAVHLSKDVKRTGPVYGYFLVGRVWDQPYLNRLSGLTVSQVALRSLAPTEKPAMEDTVGDDKAEYFQVLRGWDGGQVSLLHITSDSPGLRLLRKSAQGEIGLFIAFALLLLGLLFVCLLRWVSAPLNLLSQCLRAQQPDALAPLGLDTSEFGKLARLVQEFFAQKDALEYAQDVLEMRVLERTAELAEANGSLHLAYDDTLTGWSRALDLRDHETEGHSQRVTELTLRLARAFGLGDDELLHIRRGALLHDIGKMGVPDGILLKPGKLTDDEWTVMKMHPFYACEMLAPIKFLLPSMDIPLCHHEKWDGTGYPRGLAGEAIPLSARLFAVVDVWDALRSDRPYRKAWPVERVCDHIRDLAGTHFDPETVRAFLGIVTQCEQPSEPLRLAA